MKHTRIRRTKSLIREFKNANGCIVLCVKCWLFFFSYMLQIPINFERVYISKVAKMQKKKNNNNKQTNKLTKVNFNLKQLYENAGG